MGKGGGGGGGGGRGREGRRGEGGGGREEEVGREGRAYLRVLSTGVAHEGAWLAIKGRKDGLVCLRRLPLLLHWQRQAREELEDPLVAAEGRL